jgi:hypothetical protein
MPGSARGSLGLYDENRANCVSTDAPVPNPPLRYAYRMVAQGAPDNESLRLELQETLVTARHWSSLLIQTTGFLIAADVVLISYGFAQKLAGILLLASTLPLAILFIFQMVWTSVTPLLNLVLRIEKKLLIRGDSLGATFGRSLLESRADFGPVDDLNDEEIASLSQKISGRRPYRGPVPTACYASFVIHIAVFVLALKIFNYRFM